MTDSLAQSLVEAARDSLNTSGKTPQAWSEWPNDVTSAVILRLAEAVEAVADPGAPLAVLDTYLLRDLGDQIRESPCP